MTVTNQNQLYIIISVSRSPLVLIESSGCTVMQLCSWHISAVHKSWHGPMIALSDDCDLLPSFWPVLVMRAEELMWWTGSMRLFLCAAIVSIHTGCCHAKVRVPRSPWSAACQQTYGVILYRLSFGDMWRRVCRCRTYHNMISVCPRETVPGRSSKKYIDRMNYHDWLLMIHSVLSRI